MSEKFVWGQVIERFDYNFDGITMSVTKYHPHKSDGPVVTRAIDESTVFYHCQELRESTLTLFELVISFIANKQLGLNQRALVAGISKALDL
jgi:hypothetical protein